MLNEVKITSRKNYVVACTLKNSIPELEMNRVKRSG